MACCVLTASCVWGHSLSAVVCWCYVSNAAHC